MKFGIDCGHTLSGADTGAEGNGRREQDLTREVGHKVIEKLKALGHTVVDCTKDSCSSLGESLSYRVTIANNNNIDMFASIHFNAGGGRGTEVYTYGGKHFNEADNVLNEIVSLGFINRGIKDGSHLYVIRNTKARAMLIECCFIDTDDMNKYNAENIANAIIKGLTGQTVVNRPIENPINDWVARLQSVIGANADNIPGPQTLGLCPLIKCGMINVVVKLLQEKLGIADDGIFGPNTLNAVKQFQKSNGLEADGIVGPNTWRKLLGL